MGKCISKKCKSVQCKNGKVTNAKSRKCALHRIFCDEKEQKKTNFRLSSVSKAFLAERNAHRAQCKADKDDNDHCMKQAT